MTCDVTEDRAAVLASIPGVDFLLRAGDPEEGTREAQHPLCRSMWGLATAASDRSWTAGCTAGLRALIVELFCAPRGRQLYAEAPIGGEPAASLETAIARGMGMSAPNTHTLADVARHTWPSVSWILVNEEVLNLTSSLQGSPGSD